YVLSPGRPARSASVAVLVGDRLRSCDPRADSGTRALESVVTNARTPAKSRRFGRSVFRPAATARSRLELGADERRWRIRGRVAVLWPEEAALRQDVEASRHRSAESRSRVVLKTSDTWCSARPIVSRATCAALAAMLSPESANGTTDAEVGCRRF